MPGHNWSSRLPRVRTDPVVSRTRNTGPTGRLFDSSADDDNSNRDQDQRFAPGCSRVMSVPGRLSVEEHVLKDIAAGQVGAMAVVLGR